MNPFTGKRKSGQRPKKRRFNGNQHCKSGNVSQESSHVSPKGISSTSEPVQTSASRRKLDLKSSSVPFTSTFEGNIIFDKALLFSFLEDNLCCKVCTGRVSISDKRVAGLSSLMSIECNACKIQVSTRNSKLLGPKKNIPEINRRITYAMRSVGQGLEGMKTFCGIMDLYPPVSQNSYELICRRVNAASKNVAIQSMKKAADEEVVAVNSTDITVSGDGTWKTRGHTSQIGVCTVIGADTGKVIDVEVLSKACKGCSRWKGPRIGSAFKKWHARHSQVCTKNHIGSSGKMEGDGMVKLFQRSESERGVRYLNYIGDGDSSTFLSISACHPYGENVPLSKVECVGHVQKRMGSRLRKLKKKYGSKKLYDNKTISGKGRLTDNIIDQLSVFYGNAIRQHSNSVKDMRNAVWAIYFHMRSTDNEPLHSFCPAGETSWCKYNQAVSKGTAETFHHKNSLPPAVMDAIKPIFNSLSHPELLNRCLGAYTQNPNESLNSVIWQICPKISGSGRRIAEIAVYESVVRFNEGRLGRLDIMKELELCISNNAISSHKKADIRRIKQGDRRAQQNTIEKRRERRRAKALVDSKLSKKEGLTYEAGGF
ncbi:hypothetical protein AVEN_137208-1 [Araneus ventricosus]|uniref:Mutator-like transposase domain-containing protein n=1 Tax=Araneus ventricosus TaxID=182803 RepID=A0A4Y2IS70_ARAVE|nr:hypothetical protein AVEN_137208-1 [Araneus ventricosus]